MLQAVTCSWQPNMSKVADFLSSNGLHVRAPSPRMMPPRVMRAVALVQPCFLRAPATEQRSRLRLCACVPGTTVDAPPRSVRHSFCAVGRPRVCACLARSRRCELVHASAALLSSCQPAAHRAVPPHRDGVGPPVASAAATAGSDNGRPCAGPAGAGRRLTKFGRWPAGPAAAVVRDVPARAAGCG